MLRSLLIGLVLWSLLPGCGNNQDLILTRDDLKLADSLFLVSRNEWSPKLEDSCNAFREKMLPIWTDSLKNQRLSEINLMLEQYEKSK